MGPLRSCTSTWPKTSISSLCREIVRNNLAAFTAFSTLRPIDSAEI